MISSFRRIFKDERRHLRARLESFLVDDDEAFVELSLEVTAGIFALYAALLAAFLVVFAAEAGMSKIFRK